MKTIFIEARINQEIKFPPEYIGQLPHKIGLFTTIQYISQIQSIKKSLEKSNKKVYLLKGAHSQYEGQALGCDLLRLKPNKNIEAFLYIGTGEFHPRELLLSQKKPIYTFNPSSKKFSRLDQREIESILKKKKGAYLKFLASTKIGVLISTKPGQHNTKLINKLKKKYKNKKFYLLVSDTLDFPSLENFPFIECFVNTACPRIAYDENENLPKPILNAEDLLAGANQKI